MKVLHVTKSTFDVFFNSGWDNWGRFAIVNNELKQVAGVPIPNAIRTFLKNRYTKGTGRKS
jgi:hypothetical protein